MKPRFLSALHYIIFFGLVFLFTSLKGVCEYESSNTSKQKNVIKVEKIDQASVVRENRTEMLHGELLFRY